MKECNSNWTIVCYGNILRSQVLEQYLRYYAKLYGIELLPNSAGIAGKEEFPDKTKLFQEISNELDRRGIPHNLHRNPWDSDVERTISESCIVICADQIVKATVLERMKSKIDKNKVFTFYEAINEGEKDFEDTYDYDNKRQDPIKFKNAFEELERISRKMIDLLT